MGIAGLCAQQLLDRIRLVARLVSSLQGQGGQAYDQASATQAAAVKGQLMLASSSLGQTTEISEELSKIPWQPPQHRAVVLQTLAASPALIGPAAYSCSTQTCRRPLLILSERNMMMLYPMSRSAPL